MSQNNNKIGGEDSPHFQVPAEGDEVVAWQEVEEGRFMPQRVRGSCQGRALG